MILERLYWSGYLAYSLLGQKRFAFRSRAEIEKIQSDRVRRMIVHAYNTVPYYRQTLDRLRLSPSDIRSAQDLKKLPEIQRSQLQKTPDEFLSDAQPKERYLRLRSGGSTGDPCTVYHDARSIFQNAAHGERERSILMKAIGKSLGYRETVIVSPVSSAREIQEYVRENSLMPRGFGIERQYLSLLDPPEKNLDALNEFQPDLIRTYGSYLGALFPYVHSSGALFQPPRAVFYSSDALSPSVRNLIEDVFHIPVFSAYQANEAFQIGFECEEHIGLHLNMDLYPVRIADENGNALPDGESGNVILSNLVNRATVLLNYHLGDISRILKERCACGRTLPLMAFPEGRTDDWIRLDSNKQVHPQAVRTIFTNEQEVWQYQVVQMENDVFRVSIVVASACDRDQLSTRISKRFSETFGPIPQIEISYVDSLERTRGGKVRPVISLKKELLQP